MVLWKGKNQHFFRQINQDKAESFTHQRKVKTWYLHCWILINIFRRNKAHFYKFFLYNKEYFLNLSYKVSITFILTLDKEVIRENQSKMLDDDMQILNEIQQHIKRTVHYDQMWFIHGMKWWFNIHKSIKMNSTLISSKTTMI